METKKLFFDKQGNAITNIDILRSIELVSANDSDILFIHSSLSFGIPNLEVKRVNILEELFNILLKLNAPTICMPTFTFSFCNKKSYDPINSKTKMGALNEFFRLQEGVIRSNDPLLSVALMGKEKDLVSNIGHESIGNNSSYDLLRKKKNVKFLFLGTKIGDCFTYMHYLEWLYKVDYRYNKTFRGLVYQGTNTIEEEYKLFVRYNGVTPNNGSYIYEQDMYDKGLAKICKVGDSTISCVEETIASNYYKLLLEKNPYFFVNTDELFKNKDTTFTVNQEMVAL
ncbi:MAG: AAC(3) family N-acetyltransferase [Tenuifilaceae bacterium]